jgi:hypothetical protein
MLRLPGWLMYRIEPRVVEPAQPQVVLPQEPVVPKPIADKSMSVTLATGISTLLFLCFLSLSYLADSKKISVGDVKRALTISVAVAIGAAIVVGIVERRSVQRRRQQSTSDYERRAQEYRIACDTAPQRAADEARAATRSAENAASEEARKLTSMAIALMSETRQTVQTIRAETETAHEAISVAEHEYECNAFGQFWDEIERATVALGAARKSLTVLAARSASYYATLAGRCHTFPAFPFNTGDAPQVGAVAKELRKVARRGQTHRDFAVIWEHRQTRQILISGFATLREGLSGIESAIYDVANDLSFRLLAGLGDVTAGIRDANGELLTIAELEREVVELQRRLCR